MTGPVFEARGVHRSYGEIAAVVGVDLTIEAGEMVAVFGRTKGERASP